MHLEGRGSREYENPTFVAARNADPQRRHSGSVEAHLDTRVFFQFPEVKFVAAAGHLAGVVKNCHVEPRPVWNPAEFTLQQQAMPIAEPPGRIAAQSVSASERWQQEIWHRIGVLESRTDETTS